MLMNIGLGSNVGVYAEGNGFTTPFYVMRDFFGALTPSYLQNNMGDTGFATMILTVVTMFVGLFVILAMSKKGIKGSVLYGMLVASVIYWIGSFAFLHQPLRLPGYRFLPASLRRYGQRLPCSSSTSPASWKSAGSPPSPWIITFCIIDMFDTIGTLVGTASRAGMVDQKGDMPNMKEAPAVRRHRHHRRRLHRYFHHHHLHRVASGVEAGGRTGLTAVVTGLLFLACIFIAPIAAIIPAAATSAALIYVGILMLQGLKRVDFDDMDQMVPVALMLIGMPISGSIGHAIGLGLISYTIMKLFGGKAKEVSVLTYVISALFLVKFFLAV